MVREPSRCEVRIFALLGLYIVVIALSAIGFVVAILCGADVNPLSAFSVFGVLYTIACSAAFVGIFIILAWILSLGSYY